MDREGDAKRVVRGVAWATTAFRPLASGFSWPAVSAPSVSARAASLTSPAVKEYTSDHPQERPSSASFPNAEFARRCDRCSTRQSHRARRCDQCSRDCRWGSVESLQEALHKAKQSAHVLPGGERAKKRLAKADADLLRLQTERAQLATELAEGPARFEVSRTEAGAVPTTPAAPRDLGSELQRMQGVIDDLLRERFEWMGTKGKSRFPWIQGRWWFHGRHAWKLWTKQEGNDHVWRVGRVLHVGQFEKVFHQYGLRGVCVGEACHPGPSFLRLRRATSVVNVASYQVDSGRFSALDEASLPPLQHCWTI